MIDVLARFLAKLLGCGSTSVRLAFHDRFSSNLVSGQHMKLKALVLIVLFSVGCAGPSTRTFVYSEPELFVALNQDIVRQPIDKVWDTLVRQLNQSEFIVDSIDEESRRINLSRSTNRPEQYLDCGTYKVQARQGDRDELHEYQMAASSSYRIGGGISADGKRSFITHVRRQTSLEAQVEVHVTHPGDASNVKVSARYILTLESKGEKTTENVYGHVIETEPVPTSSYMISFSTNQQNKNSEGIVCLSLGVLESEVLEMVRY